MGKGQLKKQMNRSGGGGGGQVKGGNKMFVEINGSSFVSLAVSCGE